MRCVNEMEEMLYFINRVIDSFGNHQMNPGIFLDVRRSGTRNITKVQQGINQSFYLQLLPANFFLGILEQTNIVVV